MQWNTVRWRQLPCPLLSRCLMGPNRTTYVSPTRPVPCPTLLKLSSSYPASAPLHTSTLVLRHVVLIRRCSSQVFEPKTCFFDLISSQVPEELYEVFEEPSGYIDEKNPGPDIPLSLEEFMNEMRDTKPNARTFGLKLKSMVHCLIISF